MRSLVLLWCWHISWRANGPGQYLRGLFSTPFKNSWWGAYPLVLGLMQPTFPLTLMVLDPLWMLSGGWRPQQPPDCLQPLHLLCPPDSLSKGVPDWMTLLWPTLSITFILSIWNKTVTNQHLWWAFGSCLWFLFFLVNGHFLVLGIALFFQRMLEECSWLAQILEREDRELEKAVREQIGNIFPSTSGLENVEFFVLKGL